MTELLISFIIATIGLAISPGPDNIYVLTQSLVNGVESGIATTAGLISGCIVHTTLLAFGLSAIITTSEVLFYGIKVLGAIYLLFLAFKVYKSDTSISLTTNPTKKSNWELFKTGVIMNLVNPKVMIFFLAFFPGFLWDENGNTIVQFYILGITFMVVSFFVFSIIAIAAGRISSLLQEWKNMNTVLKWLQIIVFLGIAVFIMIP